MNLKMQGVPADDLDVPTLEQANIGDVVAFLPEGENKCVIGRVISFSDSFLTIEAMSGEFDGDFIDVEASSVMLLRPTPWPP